jgi:glucan phosphorylase
VMNGVMNFSVLDGWWCEGYRPGAGWALPEHDTYADPDLQNELDAETIYNILESDIIPTYFGNGTGGSSEGWLSHIKNTIAGIAPEFVMKRMLDDYQERYYGKLWDRSQKLKKNKFTALFGLVDWKNRLRRAWDAIELTDLQAPDTFNHSLPLGENFKASVTLQLHELGSSDVGVEVVFFRRISETELELIGTNELELEHQKGALATYSCDITPKTAGVFEYGFRMFPKHPLLPHRQDFGLVRWL